MIQIIPFQQSNDPEYLQLLVRGLVDLTILRFNTVHLDSELNTSLEIKEWPSKSQGAAPDFLWKGQDLWFTGDIQLVNEIFHVTLVLFDPALEKVVYLDRYEVPDKKFLDEWEAHLHEIVKTLADSTQSDDDEKVMYTHSLEAFLEFRNGLEILTQNPKEQKREEGLEHLLAAVAYDSKFTEAADILLLFIVQNNHSQNYGDTIAILERLRLYVNHHPRIPLVMAEVYFQWGNYEKTEEILEEVITQFPDFSEGWLKLALLYQFQGDNEHSVEVLQNFLDNHPDHSTALDLMGAIYAGIEEHEKAAKLWLRALELEPARVNVLNNLGLLSEETDDFEAAESYYLKAIGQNDHWWGSFYNYGSFCIRKGREEEGVILLKKASALNPSHYQTFIILAETQVKLGQFIEAEESIMQLLQTAPDNVARRQALKMVGQLNEEPVRSGLRLQRLEKLFENGRRGLMVWQLLKYYFKAHQLWRYWYLWSMVLAETRLNCFVVMSLRTGLNYNPGYPLLKKIGLYYWKKGLFVKALPILCKAFNLHQHDDEIIKAYTETLIKLGKVEEYQSQIKRSSKPNNNISG